MKPIAIAIAIVSLAACTVAPGRPEPADMDWVLVQRPGSVAVLAVLSQEPPPIHSRLLRETAAVGDVAEMEIWADRDVDVRLSPSRAGIRILGPEVIRVGPEPQRVRFTADSPGRGTVTPRNAEEYGGTQRK
jgi:hypothetical protein